MKNFFTTIILAIATSFALFAQTVSPGLANQEAVSDMDQLKIEMMENLHAETQPGVIPGVNQTNGNHYSKYQGSNGTREVLYDNGPFITAEGVGSNGSDYSELQDASLGMGTYGQGVQLSAGNSLADEFEATGTWILESITVYGYQTGSGLPSTLTGVYMQIWDGNPTSGGSVIWGDLTTNIMLSTEWTNAWRVLESGPLENRPIMAAVADLGGLSLNAGTYWIEYSLDGNGASGPWNPPVTIIGETTTGNALQNQSGTWVALEDVGPQGIPFVVEGYWGMATDNDVSVSAFVEPVSGVDLTAAEPITLTLKNNGLNTQISIPWEVTWDGPTGAQTVSGTFTGSLASGETIDVTLPETADLSVYGDYVFEACTQLASDENPANDCKTKMVFNVAPSLCVDNLYSSGCGFGDGLIYWSLENIEIPDIPCSGNPEWYHDYTDQIHELNAGQTHQLTVMAGYDENYFDVWIDYNDDLYFSNDELVLDNAFCPVANTLYVFDIEMPDSPPPGQHMMRYRTNWQEPVEESCETYSYGNCSDFSVEVYPAILKDVGVESIDILSFQNPGVIEPMATVANYGTEPQSFAVGMDFGYYSSTVYVSELMQGTTQQVTFDTVSVGFGSFVAVACTQLEGDENSTNDCKAKPIIVFGAQNCYAYIAEDNSGTWVEGPAMFNLETPIDLIQLAPTSSNEIITGACWAGDTWWGCQQGGGLYWIDHTNGDMTFVGDGPACNGLAFDGTLVFGASETELFEIDPATGQGTPIGVMGNAGGQMMGIACDGSGGLYGFDVYDNLFYSIDKATGAATAIGPLGFDFEGPQDMAIDKNTGQCYITGYTTAGGLYSVDINTGAASLLGEFPNGIRLTGFAIPNGEAPPVGPPPQGFDAQFVEDVGVECSWGMAPPPIWLGYDDGVNAGGLGANGGGTFYAAIRWDSADLIPYNGSSLTAFKFFPLMFAVPSEITFHIWEGNISPQVVYEQELQNLSWNEWNTIYLDEPYIITAEQDLWVGFKATHPDGEDPIGYDDGPAISGYGDLISFDGTNWVSMSVEYGLDKNINLQILVEENSETNFGDIGDNPKAEFLGINIYRDGNLVNSNLIEPGVVQYTDPFFDPGTWTYTAKAVYDDGLSEPTPGVEVVIPGTSEISVSPDSLYEIHETPPQITMQDLTITNTGDEPLEWEIGIDFGNKKFKNQKTETKEYKKFSGGSLNNDVGIWSIVEPTSGVYLGTEEPITIKVKNYGNETQTDIPWEVNWSGPTGGETFSGNWTGSLSAGEEVDLTLIETVDMSVFGEYEFEACTQLPGDEFSDNDCKYKSVICIEPSLCSPDYSFGCGYGDGLISWDLANIQIPEIPCEGQPEYYHDYRDHIHQLTAGNSFELTVKAGYDDTYFIIWIDTDDDYDLYDEEPILSAAYCEFANIPYSFNIEIPDDMPLGEHVLRYRTNWTTPMYDPCETYSYGNCCDFTVNVTDILNNAWISVGTTNGVIAPGESQIVTVTFVSENIEPGLYETDIVIESNDTVNPVVEVPVSLEVIGTTNPLLFYETFEEYEAGGALVQQAIAQGKDYWTTLNNQPGGAEDPLITYDAGVGITGLIVEEGNEPVLDFGETYIDGLYNIEFSFKKGYNQKGTVNILQKFDGIVLESGLQIEFVNNGLAVIHAGEENAIEIYINPHLWHRFRCEVDLDNDMAQLFINDGLKIEWQWSLGAFGNGNLNQLAALHFSGDGSGSTQILYDHIIMVEGEWPGFLPPLNLQSGWAPGCNGFFMTWDNPGYFSPQWITYSNEEIFNSIGTNDEVSFDVAARWEPDDLAGFPNGAVSKINFVPGEPDDICTYSLRIWQGGNNNPILIYDQELSNVVSDEWNEVELASIVPFDHTEELWIGFNCNTTAGYPAGCDDGPQAEGYGNMMFWEGEWVTLSSLNSALTYNWAIQGFIESDLDGFKSTKELAIPVPQYKNQGNLLRNPESFDKPAVTENIRNYADLQGFNFYFRDMDYPDPWELWATGLQVPEYCAEWPLTDYWFRYYVTAIYEWNDMIIESGRSFHWDEAESIEEFDGAIKIWPNPVNDNLSIESVSRIIQAEIFNINGLKIFAYKPSENIFHINTSRFSPGIYTLQLETEKGLSVHKIVIR
jgi:hypothetical protein